MSLEPMDWQSEPHLGFLELFVPPAGICNENCDEPSYES